MNKALFDSPPLLGKSRGELFVRIKHAGVPEWPAVNFKADLYLAARLLISREVKFPFIFVDFSCQSFKLN